MGRISNLELARLKLDELMVNHDGLLTSIYATGYLNQVTEEFNLSIEKSCELKGFKYSRQVLTGPVNKIINPDHEQLSHEENQSSGDYQENPEPQSEHISTNITEADFFALQDHCQNLENLISRLAVNTGNANWLSEYGVERWVPGKKHMNKRYA